MGKVIKYGLALVVLSFMIAISSCKKGPKTLSPNLNANASVFFTGDLAADGCGWLMKVGPDSTEYSPANLPDAFKKQSLKVTITYRVLTTRYSCGQVANLPGITEIEIESIK